MNRKLNFANIAPNLTGKERAKALILHWRAESKGKKILTEIDEKSLMKSPDIKVDATCWFHIELWRWGNMLWIKEIISTWETLDATTKTIALMMIFPPSIEHPFLEDIPKTKLEIERKLCTLAAYQQAIAQMENTFDGIALFEEETYMYLLERFTWAEHFPEFWNDFMVTCEKDESFKITAPAPKEEEVKEIVDRVRVIADFFSQVLEKAGEIDSNNGGGMVSNLYKLN